MGFTPEQIDAIEAQGKVIVSASAGSGKTTVMIEKIIRLITSGVGVDRILAVTFTNKAAASMKEKLCKALIEEINKPETDSQKRADLKKQLSLVSTADISTIHSYCAKLIRSHFYVAGVDSNFRVIGGEDAEGKTLKNAALDELLEEGYQAQDEAFVHLLSVYFRYKKDATLRAAILGSYKNLRDRADYRDYLRKTALGYTEEDFDAVCADSLALFQEKCKYYYELVEDEYGVFMEMEQESPKQLALCKDLMGWLEQGLAAKDYFEARAIVQPPITAKSSSKKDSAEKKRHIERLAFLRDRVVDAFKHEFAKVLPRETELKNFLATGRTAAALAAYLLKFDEKYAARKDERGVLDYNDLEHKALELLAIPEIAEEVRQKYNYVFVDEYQDVNPVQEAIITYLAGDNLFLVGDVKQSIYGFRGSKSKFFLQKQEELKVPSVGQSLYMKYNFRSTDKVLDAVNEQFCLAMTPSVCGIDYAKTGVMEKGGRYATNSGKVCIHFVGKEEKTKSENRGVYSVRENTKPKRAHTSPTSDMLIRIIREELMGYIENPSTGETRPVRYSDIAILTRKAGDLIAGQAAALADAGIPVSTASSVNICEYTEVKALIDILSLIDNEEQDIPLCSALLSSMGSLTADDLADIRLEYKGMRFRHACKKYSCEKKDEIAKKLNKFYEYFHRLKIESCVMTAGEVLSKILADTKMEAGLLSRKSGVACLKRIRRFIEEANNFDGYCVHDFLEHLRNLEYVIEYSENGGEDSVRIITMHSSKGLEYPIVLLPNLSQPFKGGTTPDVYVEEEYGLAPYAFDTEKLLQAPNLLRKLHETKSAKSAIADELNLYYVALTRAERTLHLLFTDTTPVPDVKYAKSFAEMTDFGVWSQYIVQEPAFDVKKLDRQALIGKADESAVEEVLRAYKWEYAHTGYENMPVKSSPTELLSDGKYLPKQHFIGYGKVDEEEAETAKEENSTDRETAIAEGTAYHAFLEFFDFSTLVDGAGKPVEKVVLEGLVADMLPCLSEKGVRVELLSEKKLVEILSNPVFYELQGSRLYKEQQFLVSLPVKDTYAKKEGVDSSLVKKTDGEEMLFQGAIDLLAVGEEIRIIDYKYSKRGAADLKTHYQTQLDLYKLAVAKILKVDVAGIRCSIVNIRRGFQVDMD